MSDGPTIWDFDLTAAEAYPSARAAAEHLVKQIAVSLSDQLVGVYFDGSIALGDFNPTRSDIDLVVLTQVPLTDSAAQALRALHADLARSASTWGEEVEVIYVSMGDLDERSVQHENTHNYVERGTADLLRTGPLDLGWLVHLSVLSRKGITILGPDIRGLVAPVTDQTLRRSAALGVEARLQYYRDNPASLERPGARAFAVLTACRMLETFRTGFVVSKMEAARAAEHLVDAQLANTIQAALSWQKNDRDFAASPQETLRVLEFVRAQCTPER